MEAKQLSVDADMKNYEENREEDDELFLAQNYDVIDQMGFFKHGFILSFYFLLRSANAKKQRYTGFFEHVLRQVITLAGDADTNATIVMGMIGALVGIKEVPESMLTKLIDFDCTT